MDATEAFVVVMVVGMTCGIPLLGLTIRFSFKPLVEAYIRLREAQLASPQLHSLQQRVAYLERELELLRLPAGPPSTALQLSAPEHLPVPTKDRV
jgi:hypothetical protein